jgi:Beta-propeller repeat
MNDQAATFARRKAGKVGVVCFLAVVITGGLVLGRRSLSQARVGGRTSSTTIRAKSPNSAAVVSGRARLKDAYARLPLSFEANEGQADSHVRFLAHGKGFALLLTRDKAVLALRSSSPAASRRSSRAANAKPGGPPTSYQRESLLTMQVEGVNPKAVIRGMDELPGKTNYFVGRDPAKWRTGISNYAKVRYEEVYPGIDLVYYGNQRQLEFDFDLSPDANPAAIDLRLHGAEQARLSSNGDLVLDSPAGRFVFRQPVVYQTVGAARKRIPGGYVVGASGVDGSREVRFQVGHYDRSRALVIDPTLTYSTYLGGTGNDFVYSVAVDSSGDAYATGTTYSTDFPTLGPYQSANAGQADVFITKFNASGSALVYSTYIGGSSFEEGNSIAIDSKGNAYVTGITYSTDYPTTAGVIQTTGNVLGDGFVTELNASGSSLVYSTYLGGSGSTQPFAIAVDSADAAYVAGNTTASDFPVASAYQSKLKGSSNAFVAKIAAGGTKLNYSTYLGGSGSDSAFAIAVSGGNPYVVGQTTSNDFPTANPYQASYKGSTDAFVAKLVFSGANATLAYSTYLGGTGSDEAYGVAVDSSGNVYVAGATGSTNFPTMGAYQSTFGGGATDAFLAKFDSSGSKLVYSTYLGGSGAESVANVPEAEALAIDSAGKAYLTGATTSTDFPLANPVQPTYGGNQDAFIAVLNPMGCGLSFSSYLGGSAADYATGVAVDPSGDAILGGVTQSNDFFTAKPWQVKTGGNYDGFVAKIAAFTAPSVCLSPNTLTFPAETVMTTSQPMSVTLTNAGDETLDITSIAASGPYGETDTCGTSVAAGQNCSISVTFSPLTSALSQAGLVTVTDNAAGVTGATQFVALTGDGADFQMQVTPGSSTITAGQTATFNLTLLASAKFSDKVSLSCDGMPAPGSCKVSPSSITAIEGSNSTGTVTVSTVAKSSLPPSPWGRFHPPAGWLAALLLLSLGALAAFARRAAARPIALRVATLAGIALLVIAWFGCGVSSQATNYTLPGNYSIHVTGTDGALSHTITVAVTVQ